MKKFIVFMNAMGCATHHCRTVILAPSVTHLHTSVTICLLLNDRQHIVLSRYRIVSVCPLSCLHSVQFHTKPRVESHRKLIVTLQEIHDSLAPLCTCSGVRPKPLLATASSLLPWPISSVIINLPVFLSIH